MRGYPTPEGSCLLLGDMITVLDLPVKVDLAARRASGWAFREDNRLDIDAAARTVRFGAKQEALAPARVRETPDGWCVDSDALGRWLGIGVKVSPYSSVVTLTTEAKLPVELSREREMRAKHLKKPAAFPLEGLPTVKLAYRMWRAPALDFIVSAGVTYDAGSGARIDRRAAIRAAGEVARLSYDATVTSSDRGLFPDVRFKAYRSDPDGGLLGPLDATHFALGDVAGPTNRLIAGGSGRGAEVTNRPLFNPASFDRTRFDGDLPAGWDAELYRNGQLVAFAKSNSAQRYAFEDVELGYGDNRFEIVTFGPQGQQRSRIETINVGQEHVPPGKTYYYAGLNQPGSDLLGFVGERADRPDIRRGSRRGAQAPGRGVARTWPRQAHLGRRAGGDDDRRRRDTDLRRRLGAALDRPGAGRGLGRAPVGRRHRAARLGDRALRRGQFAAEGVAAQISFTRAGFEAAPRDARLTVTAPLDPARCRCSSRATCASATATANR